MGYSKKDAAKDTDTSAKEVSKTWHQAKDDAGESLPERQETKIQEGHEKLVDDANQGGNKSK